MVKQLCFIAIVTILSCNNEQSNQAGFVAFNNGKDTVELGSVERGGSKDFNFPIKNNTKEPINILGVEGSCSCVNLKYDSVVNGGSSIDMRGTYSATKKDSVNHPSPDVLEAISIRTSGTDQPLKVIYVTGRIH